MTDTQKTFILSIIVSFIFIGCSNKQNIKINPLNDLKQVDKLLSKIAEKPKKIIAPSTKKTIVTGAKGTIIHINPDHLETIDGSPLGDNIDIELLEMTTNSSLILNNAQTISNGQVLVTGGAYYLNMTSNGKQLRMKSGKGLNVEFPKLTENEMGLFLGERDTLGQINWIPTKENFVPKNLSNAKEPKKLTKKKYIKKTYDGIDAILGYVSKDSSALKPKKIEEVTEEEYKDYLEKKAIYEEQQKQIEYQRKTYEAIQIMNFGWINCDRFLNDTNPKSDIQFLINNDSLTGARIFAIFNDINSIISTNYRIGQKDTTTLKNIPIDKELQIIALSTRDEVPYIFETTINTSIDKQVQVIFTETTQEEIKKKMKSL